MKSASLRQSRSFFLLARLCLLCLLSLCGFPPFYHESTAALYKQIKRGEFDFPAPYWTNISESAKDLVRKLLTVDPAKRFSAKQVLEHPWISGTTASSAPLGGDYNRRLVRQHAHTPIQPANSRTVCVVRDSLLLASLFCLCVSAFVR